MVAFISQSIEGINFLQAYDAISTSTPEVPAHPHVYGTVVTATDGSLWVFGKVATGATVNQYNCVMIDITAAAIIPSLGGAAVVGVSKRPGWYQGATSLTAGMAGWFMLSGAPRLGIEASCNPAVQLYTTQTSGILDDAVATGSQYPVRNVYIMSASGTSLTNVQGFAQFPTFGPMTALA
jgi:hypothetical protein